MMRLFTKKSVTRLFLFGCVGLMGFVFAIRVYATQNYSDPDGPRFSGSYAEGDLAGGSVTAARDIGVLSYNIRYGLNMNEAIAELETLSAMQGADIILLQEMDEIGVEQVGRDLPPRPFGCEAEVHQPSIHSPQASLPLPPSFFF